MAERVFVHIGLPKTATTYLQTILWGARDQLRDEGLLVPGTRHRDHLFASRILRGEPARGARDARAESAWDRLRAEIVAWPERALISHEFFAAASPEQAAAMVAQLAGRSGRGAASLRFSRSRRTMFSTSITASSTTSPIAIASPPSVMVFRL